MSVTFVPSLERDDRRSRSLVDWIDARHALLPPTSLVAILAIALAYSGRTRAPEFPVRATAAAAPVNTDAVTDAKTFDAPLALVFAHPADREFAASALLQ